MKARVWTIYQGSQGWNWVGFDRLVQLLCGDVRRRVAGRAQAFGGTRYFPGNQLVHLVLKIFGRNADRAGDGSFAR